MKTLLKTLLGLVCAVLSLILVAYFSLFERNPDKGKPVPITTSVAATEFESAIATGRQRVGRLRVEAQYPSISGAVIVDNLPVWQEAIGYGDVAAREVATTSLRYPIGSISKTLTATAAMKLAADGILDLDVPIETYWSELPQHYHGVSLRHLLSHQAGVRHYGFAPILPTFSESYLNVEFPSVEAGLSLFINDPPLFAPDESFTYSTYGYSLVSRIMEAATGDNFLALMDRVLIDPLGLVATEPDRANPEPVNCAQEYLAPISGAGILVAPATNSSFKWAGGGYVSTPLDLVKFGAALMAGDFLADKYVDVMTTPRRTNNGEYNIQNYGLGWRVGALTYPPGTATTVPIFHHGGTAAGAECILILVPGAKLAAAFCGNAYTGGSGRLLQLSADVARDFMNDLESVQ